MLTIAEPTDETEVLLIHAPYPGRLKFDALPSSLLYASAPLAHALATRGQLGKLGIFDPGASTEEFDALLHAVLARARLRVVAVSTSTAAIEETSRIIHGIREVHGEQVLVMVGGPHEDDCEEKVALHVAGVDLSVAGDAGCVFECVVSQFLARSESPRSFVALLPELLLFTAERLAGRFSLSSRWWRDRKKLSLDCRPLEPEWLGERPLIERRIRFSVFSAPETVPLLVSVGCSYGRCSFCAEGGSQARRQVLPRFDAIASLTHSRPAAALYFQDSIFPKTAAVRSKLLPLLRELGVEWGAQVYLGTLTRDWVGELARSGCRYLYTGVESGASEVLRAVGKPGLDRATALERLGWVRDAGMSAGISIMFGALASDGTLVESESSVDATVDLAHEIVADGVSVAGFYPNIETVLPGTPLARGLAAAGHRLDFYRMPRTEAFVDLEDGFIGHNFMTVAPTEASRRERLAQRIVEASKLVATLSSNRFRTSAGA